jgi:hypothetical protein
VWTLEEIAWRVDFILSSRLLDSVNEPSVQLKLTVRDPVLNAANTLRFAASADTLTLVLSGTPPELHSHLVLCRVHLPKCRAEGGRSPDGRLCAVMFFFSFLSFSVKYCGLFNETRKRSGGSRCY